MRLADFSPLLLWVSVGAGLFCLSLLVQSLLFPRSRTWPVVLPLGEGASLRGFLNRSVGALTGLAAICLAALAYLDIQSWPLPRGVQGGLGALFFFGGGFFALRGFLTLGPELSTGTPGELELRGVYRFSRNPQYTGTVVVLLGTVLLSSSALVALAALPWCLWFLLAPFPEEGWLRDHLGKNYEDYCSRTRRYL